MWRVLGESPDDERVHTAELIGALCLATDLGMGFPFEHGLHETLIAMRLAERLRVDRDTASQTYYTALLSHAGCTAEAHVAAEVFGGSMTESRPTTSPSLSSSAATSSSGGRSDVGFDGTTSSK